MKMKIRWTPLLSLVLVVWTLFSGYLLLQVGDRYIGKNYFDSMGLEYSMDEFIQEIGPVVLNPVDPEAMKSKLTVSQEEIDEHRYQYGDLGEQLENIRQQYEARIDEAEVNNATDLEKKLIAERDAKIKDITLNFESDEHIKKKILAEKEKQVDTYINELQAYKNQLLKDYDYIAFDLTNVETGEHFTTGDINDSALLIKEYKGTAKLKTWSISENLLERNDLYLINALYSRNYNSENQESKSVNKSYEYTGQVMIPESTFNTYSGEYEGDSERFERNSIIYSIIWLSGFVTLILVLTLYRPKLEDYLVSNKLKDRLTSWTLDVQVVVLGLTWVFFYEFMENAYMPIETVNYQNKVSVIFNLILGLSLMFVFGLLFLLQLVWVYDRVKTWDQLTKEVRKSMLWKLGYSTKDLFLNRGIGVQSLILISAAFFGGIGLISSWYSGGMSVLLCFVCIIIGIPSLLVFLSRMGYMNRIMKATSELADGRLTGEIKVKGQSPFAQHAQNINKLREGVRNSMNEQAKSERLKTELITNVSHDLRTPLTSIITYTDLLKNPAITEEERKQYIDVLDKKSARLKTLIEDLFEVSKMASGNIELHKQKVDLTQLVKQAVGEHEEDLAKARLDLRIAIPDTTLLAYVDGQKWWRVIDNLVVNVLKYSLEGTRVYVTLKRTVGGDAELIVKNVAKYEVSENVDELFERFKRADTSRHTDGSGLGLAIAQSIVDLHNGRMSIEVDGDLFKVIVTVPAI